MGMANISDDSIPRRLTDAVLVNAGKSARGRIGEPKFKVLLAAPKFGTFGAIRLTKPPRGVGVSLICEF